MSRVSNGQAKPTTEKCPITTNEIPTEPWAIISMDLIGPLVQSKGKDMILVIVDRFSKKAYFLPCNTTITAQGVVTLY